MKIGFIGDIVGKPGREMIKRDLKSIRREHSLDFVVANAENLSHGFGFTPKNVSEIFSYGVDFLTSGNHAWDKKEGIELLKSPDYRVIRPLNYPLGVPGFGSKVLNICGEEIAIINLMGHYGMPLVDNVFISAKKEIDRLKELGVESIFIDFHAEATSEKRAMHVMLKGKITALLGTHTHIGTDDLIIEEGSAYVSDIGLSGCRDSVIGMDSEAPLKRFLTSLPAHLDIPKKCKKILQMIIIESNEGKAVDAYKIKALDEKEAIISMKAMREDNMI